MNRFTLAWLGAIACLVLTSYGCAALQGATIGGGGSVAFPVGTGEQTVELAGSAYVVLPPSASATASLPTPSASVSSASSGLAIAAPGVAKAPKAKSK